MTSGLCLNRFTLVTPKSANDVQLRSALNPIGAVSMTNTGNATTHVSGHKDAQCPDASSVSYVMRY